MVNNDCITFSVIYQQPFEVTAKHFTWIGGELIYQEEWDNKRTVAKGRTYEVDMTSRGPYDVIKAGKFTGDYSNPVTEEQYAFTVNENMTVALIYQKVNADYKVEHYKQNIADDNYTLIDTDKKMGNVGAEPEYEYRTFTGFTKNTDKAVIPDAILEDDSTVVKLYYDRNVHAVALDKGTGIQSVTGAGAYRYGQTVNISASVGPGYNWEKWDGLSSSISESFIMPDNDLTYKACASPKSFAVTFIGNGGTADPVSRVVTYNSTNWNTGAVTGKRLGYDIGGWYTQANEPGGTPSGEKVFDAGGNAVKGTYWSDNGSSAVWKGLSDLTVYAHWLPKTFTMYFNYNIPSNADKFTLKGDDIKQKEVAYKEKIGSMPSPTLAGYTFQRWSKTEDKTSPDVKENDLYKILDDSTVYAQWGPAWYTIVYDTGGGSWKKNVPANPDIAGYYEDITIYAPERTGYDFTGWNIESMDSFTHVLDGTVSNETSAKNVASGKASAVFKGLRGDNGEVRFTAQWAATPFSITYNLNGAADPGNPATYTIDTPTFPLINPSKEGYGFKGWTGTGLNKPELSVVISKGSTGDREYTANFIANSYRIEYVLDGGTAGTYAPDEAVYDSTITISNPTKPGATFEGWDITGMDGCTHTLGTATTTDDRATGIKATSYKNLRSTYETVTFTAKWKYISYNITYDFNGGCGADFGSYPASAMTWNEFTVTTPVHDSGFNFLGWTITGMDNGEHRYGGYTSNDSTLAGIKETEYENLRYSSGTVKFTAAWERPVRQIVFMSDDGEMTGESVQDGWTMRFIRFGDKLFTVTNEYGISWGTDVPRADKTGYSFLGYYDSIDGGNQLYTGAYTKSPGLYWDADGRWIGPSLIIYAQYTPKRYKVYYNLNGGMWADDSSSGESDVTVTYDSTDYNKYYGESDVYRKGYIFEGWYDAVTGGVQVYKTNGSCVGGSYWSTDYVE